MCYEKDIPYSVDKRPIQVQWHSGELQASPRKRGLRGNISLSLSHGEKVNTPGGETGSALSLSSAAPSTSANVVDSSYSVISQ